ncbi:hypothetical protein PHLCEN_2v10103 [Hermanssonia centrifuga]|uniref:Uncharacterized protein n=1 Tax=Hermanssonia centrifuga TaxID=98765 RepID=A0A2R6NP03_9APHY|nr:hypothetical protein PHLCEN_2v10103 [Hermanssonia centrifuga]
MSISNYDTAIRNQSEATTHSRGSSPPADSHNDAHSQRKSKSAAPFRSVGMSSVNALKTLNSGWQVWANPSSDSRNTPASSAATIPESSPSQAEGAYRSGLGAEHWNNARATSGSWDEDLSPPVSLNTTRQRQAGSTQVSSLGSNSLVLPKANQYSPQRYDSTASNTPSRYSAASPTRAPYGSSNSPFSAQQPLVHSNHAPSYDPAQAPSTIDHDLSAAMRGMAVEDEFSANQAYRQPQPSTAGGQPQSSAPQHARGPHPLQQSRGPYSGYPQADYAAYYAGPSRVEYPYPYEPYRHGDSMYASSPALSASSPAPSGYPAVAPQNIHPHSVPDLRGQQFYDYSSPGRPHSQFYYPSQPMMYHAPPSPMIRGPVHSKKRSMQVWANYAFVGYKLTEQL